MGQECFYRENRKDRGEREVLLTERLAKDGGQMLFRIRPMSQRENEDIWLRCGEDEKRYEGAVLAESVVFPDLKDAALQNSYGVVGAERLLKKLLLAGEYDRLRMAVEEINGGEGGCIEFI
ncbi:MAG: phage portal protein [Anaerotignum sp.]|nr:phage portal protein [Anaerotignum sp.]